MGKKNFTEMKMPVVYKKAGFDLAGNKKMGEP